MNLDREYLEATLRNLRVQEREGIEMAAMARGAIQITEALVARLAEPEPTISTGPDKPEES